MKQLVLLRSILVFVFFLLFSGIVAGASFVDQVRAMNSATCQTGFNRPLLFGVNPNPGSASALQTVPDTGSTIAKVSANWDRIEPTAGQVNTEEYNFPIRKWEETGLVLMVNLSGTPEWAKDKPALPVHKAQPRRNDALVEQRFRTLVYTMVSTNKDKAKYWSYWNEPNGCMSNISSGDCGYNSGTASDYVHWLNIFYDEVHRADPNAIVIGGNLEMVKNIDTYVGYMNDNQARYDWLGVNPYHKYGNYPLPLEWVKSAYEKQRERKPIFLNEWGFNTDWSGVDENAATQRITEAFSELTKPENSWIIGASYHNVRDIDGEDGLRDANGLRPRGVEFKRIVQTVCNPAFGGGAPPPPANPPPEDPPVVPAACVVATNNLHGDTLRHNQSVVITSVANEDVKEFTYAFYNLDNKNNDGTPKAYCIKGLAHTANCPVGSGQLRLKSTEPKGYLQSISKFLLPNGQISTGAWISDQGWTSLTTANNNWQRSNLRDLGGSGEMHAQDVLPAINVGQVSFWRGPIGYQVELPYTSNKSALNWSGANIRQVANLNTQSTIFPGYGQIIAQTSLAYGDQLYQFIWRQDGRGYKRVLPLKSDGLPNWSGIVDLPGNGYIPYNKVSDLPGSGQLQAVDMFKDKDGNAFFEYWRGNRGYIKKLEIIAGQPEFNFHPDNFRLAQEISDLPTAKNANSLAVLHSQLTLPDANNSNKIPQRLQVNAWFTTTSNSFVSSNINCVTSFKIDNSPLAGDFNHDCKVNLSDFNQFRNSFRNFSCNYNLVGDDCYIYLDDFNEFRDEYGKVCSS